MTAQQPIQQPGGPQQQKRGGKFLVLIGSSILLLVVIVVLVVFGVIRPDAVGVIGFIFIGVGAITGVVIALGTVILALPHLPHLLPQRHPQSPTSSQRPNVVQKQINNPSFLIFLSIYFIGAFLNDTIALIQFKLRTDMLLHFFPTLLLHGSNNIITIQQVNAASAYINDLNDLYTSMFGFDIFFLIIIIIVYLVIRVRSI